MKSVLSFMVIFQASLWAQAASDSVAFFFTPQKAVVLINESSGAPRLQAFMSALQAEARLEAQSQDASVRVTCNRTADQASCTFGFAPGAFTQFGNKTLDASLALKDLNLPEAGDFEMTFESSREDRFTLKIEGGQLVLKASKRGA